MLLKLNRHRIITSIQHFYYLKRWYIFLIVIFFLLSKLSNEQRREIDSIRKVLPALQGRDQINSLNELGKYYCNYLTPFPRYGRTDSAQLYVNEAYQEALAGGYKAGIAEAVLNLAEIYTRRCEFVIAQNYAEKAISMFKEIKDDPRLNYAHLVMANILFREGNISAEINNLELALEYYRKVKDISNESLALDWLSECYIWKGNFDKAYEYLQNQFDLLKDLNDPKGPLNFLYRKEEFYIVAGWVDSVTSYSDKIIAYKKKMGLDTGAISDKAFRNFKENKWDSCQYYYRVVLNLVNSNNGYDTFLKKRGILRNEIDFASAEQSFGNYKAALPVFMKALNLDKENNYVDEELEVLLNISGILEGEGKHNDAINYAQTLLSLAQNTGASSYVEKACKILSEIYIKKKDSATAYRYYLRFIDIKDSTITGKYTGKLTVLNALASEKEQQAHINVLDKDNKLKESNIQRNILIRNILITGVFALILIGFIIYRVINLKRKNEKLEKIRLQFSLDMEQVEHEKKQSVLQNKTIQLEIQALRAQMNPHFIFNCLNSINRFTLANEATKAADYLTKFAKLIRIVLQQSGKSFIPLEDELYCLQLYMDLEALRFETPFSYEINPGRLNISAVMVPPLLLQPFVENAIWHGLHPKQCEGGKIIIDFKLSHEILDCSIYDNGIGRIKSTVLREEEGLGKKSLGIKLTRSRLELFESSLKQDEAVIVINDLTNEKGQSAGTSVHIKIPVKQFNEEYI